MTHVLVEHKPGVWIESRIERQWRYQGRWRLSCFYFVDLLQFYRVFDAADCRPVDQEILTP